MRQPVLVVAIIGFLSTGALAQTSGGIICSEPVNPTCVDSDLTYQDSERTKRCRADVEAFAGDVRAYMDCLAKKVEQQKARLEAITSEFKRRAAEAD